MATWTIPAVGPFTPFCNVTAFEGVDEHLGHLRVSLSCWDGRLIKQTAGRLLFSEWSLWIASRGSISSSSVVEEDVGVVRKVL